jgi:polysaccharide export outer membrane protein
MRLQYKGFPRLGKISSQTLPANQPERGVRVRPGTIRANTERCLIVSGLRRLLTVSGARLQASTGEASPARLLLPSLALVLAASAVTAAPPGSAEKAPPEQRPAASARIQADLEPSYFIAPGDVLKIQVWKEPELSTEAFVPLLGDLMAAGRTPDDLAGEIQAKLGRFLEVPQVTLSVSQAISARFYVLGEVMHPGAFPLPSRVSIVQALALAGGFREFAKKESIRILRYQGGGEQTAIPFNYKEVEAGLHLEQNIFLEAGDTILVP